MAEIRDRETGKSSPVCRGDGAEGCAMMRREVGPGGTVASPLILAAVTGGTR